jgi:predicted RND superfamily exporter protein
MNALVRFRWPGLIVLILAVAGVLRGVETAMVPDNSMSVWFLDSDPALEQYREFQKHFGNDEVALIHIDFPNGVYNAAALNTLRRLGSRIEALEGVERVYSAAHSSTLVPAQQGKTAAPTLPDNLADAETLAIAVASLKSSPLIVGQYVNESENQTMMWVEMKPGSEFDARRDSIIAAVRNTADQVLGDRVHHLAGIGVIYSGLNEVTEKDFGIFLGLGYLLLFGAMGWVFRSVLFALTAFVVMAAATLIMFGIYGLSGNHLNMVTSVLPVVVMVLGITDLVHFPTAFERHRRAEPHRSKRAIAVAALREVLWPCVLTTITTVAGFLALTSAPMAVVRDLGWYAAIGVGTALLAGLVLMAIAFLLVRDKATLPSHKGIHAFTNRCRLLVQQRASVAWTLIGMVVLAAGMGVSRIDVDTFTLGYLPDNHVVVTDHQAIEDTWGSYNVLEFIVRPAAGRSIDDPAVLAAMNSFVKHAVKDERIRDGMSLDNLYREYIPGGVAGEPITKDQLEILQRDLPIEWDRTKPAYRHNLLAAFRTEDGSLGRIRLIGGMLSANQLSDLLEQMNRLAGTTMGDLGSIEASGYLPLYTRIIDYVMTSQIRSFWLALGLIFVIMLIGLRSIRLALISILPNLFPVLVMFAVMGYAGIDLDIATASIAAIVIGVSIDDTVHFLWAWREAERQGMGWDDALVYAYDRAGCAAIITTILLVAGFAVLMAGSGSTVFYFGLLTSVAALAALLGDLVLLPLLLKPFTRPVQA